MPLFTTKPTDQLFERFMKHRPNFKPDAPEADRIQAELDAEKERKETHAMKAFRKAVFSKAAPHNC